MLDRNNPTRSKVLLILAVACLGGMSFFILKYLKGPPVRDLPKHAYFYDLNTGELFIDGVTLAPPIAAPSNQPGGSATPARVRTGDSGGAGGAGGAGAPGFSGVRAYVFSCGGCNEKEWYIGYLETSPTGTPPPISDTGKPAQRGGGIVAAPEARGRWFTRTSREGQRIIALAMTKCGTDKRAVNCDPP